MKKKISLIQDEYFVIENKDIKYETIEDKKVPVMKEGKTLEEYSKVYSDLMAKEV